LAIISGFRQLSICFLKKVSPVFLLSHRHRKSPRMIERRRDYHAGGRRADRRCGQSRTLFHTTLLNITTTIPSRQ
jgi:hypothetical protein